jgi:hypothetical protein
MASNKGFVSDLTNVIHVRHNSVLQAQQEKLSRIPKVMLIPITTLTPLKAELRNMSWLQIYNLHRSHEH